ncbi:hypothetical protein EV586_102323 [Tumebacillus sp. BK434]|uniref:hypothetical protein n=1 Tax=Tumebacillus sp. BK434 TaxID=2512169 RepID=UPI00104441E4|nr:hypothetical protein [Tumebacillus sp. BK434]TCP57876.1 hypothetical protein EV586_102323 [Tumebacillus sp. BK434]
MSNALKLQDVTAVINGVSRYNGGAFDTVTFKTLLVSETPIEDEYYVPVGVSPTPAAVALLKEANLKVMPYKASTLLEGTEDIQTEAQEGDTAATQLDAARLILLSLLKRTRLTPISAQPGMYVYELSYEQKIYPVDGPSGNAYEVEFVVPFDQLAVSPNAGKIEVTVLLPRQTNLLQATGVDPNGGAVSQLVSQLSNVSRTAVTFEYHIDPVFNIQYQHTAGIQA